jgi:hypothetical protein
MRKLLAIFICAAALLVALPASAGDADETMATYLNLKGQLCAKVVKVSPLKMKDTYEVRCIEYRGGSGTVDYIVNLEKGVVYKR